MTSDDFTEPVEGLLAAARAELAGKPVSDIVDAAGRQYVDLVMGGGGILGVALVGYTYALEELGVRFLRLGGTSAGSINALALAAFGPPAEAKSGQLAEVLANLDIWSFVDGPSAAQSLVRAFLQDRSVARKGLDLVREYGDFTANLGLNPGEAFRRWLTGLLETAGVTRADQLRARLRELPAGLRHRDGDLLTADQADAHLGVVATDVTTETKAVFPKTAALYWADPDGVDPALFVRASMSIPFFFHPLRVTGVPQGAAAQARWQATVGHDRFPPAECAFVDGGILSNFPVDLFHEPAEVPVTAPTFGVKLGAVAPPVGHFDRPVQFTVAVFNAARHALDNDFIARNPDFRQLVCTVDTGTQSWLDFDVTPAAKVDLFRRGAEAAVGFLRGFDWGRYKATRKELADAHRAALGAPKGGEAAGPKGAA